MAHLHSVQCTKCKYVLYTYASHLLPVKHPHIMYITYSIYHSCTYNHLPSHCLEILSKLRKTHIQNLDVHMHTHTDRQFQTIIPMNTHSCTHAYTRMQAHIHTHKNFVNSQNVPQLDQESKTINSEIQRNHFSWCNPEISCFVFVFVFCFFCLFKAGDDSQ